MQLLTAQQTKDAKDRRDEESAIRTAKLREAENEAARDLNAIREEVAIERTNADAEIAEIRANVAKEKGGIENVLIPLRAEVTELEARKVEALKPLTERENAVTERERIVTEKEGRLEARSLEIDVARDEALELAEKIADRETAVIEKEEKSARREEKVAAEEEALRQSQNTLADKWVAHHLKVASVTAELEKRQRQIDADHQANVNMKAANEAEAGRLRDEARAIRDKYTALEQAKVHLGIQ